jgi:sugar/nucleoside kinase (ribokinase family)/phosphoglycolate phosphatase-like HAD superfamily hydrolase
MNLNSDSLFGRNELAALLESLPRKRIAVLGDFCLDVYWEHDLAASEPSVETGLPTHPVRAQRYELGGAGTVVNNLLAMGVGAVRAFGVVGPDPFGAEILRLLQAKGVDRAGMLTQPDAFQSLVYIKPIREGHEQNRIDFGNFNAMHDATASALIATLEGALPEIDVVIVNEQVIRGIHTAFFQSALNALMTRHPGKTFIADCRHIAGVYGRCLRRLNEVEATKLCGGTHDYGDRVAQEEAREAALQLFARWNKPVFVSRGSRGVLVADGAGLHVVPGLHIINPTDPVGAGDSMLAGIAAALAAGCSPVQSAVFGNFVAGVTVQKLFQTGTASPAELLAIGASPDYVYAPELADDPRRASYQAGTEIEIVEPLPRPLAISHAIFDHDGTVSTLRRGWEAVMEPMMIKAILGDRFASADEALYARVIKRVREFIDKTTGIQTLVQMQGLAKLVREFGVLPETDILDEFQYKAVYLEALMKQVRERAEKLRRGELDVADFTVKKAPHFLKRLRDSGVKLYLASGTDEKDVIAEAGTLGYAELFEGRIYGAVGDVTVEAKRIVLDRILDDIGPGSASRVVTFGDGPVELRETRKRGGVAVGIASDEVCRYGLNTGKRSRLIRAGAHLIVPDFSQMEDLLHLLEAGR